LFVVFRSCPLLWWIQTWCVVALGKNMQKPFHRWNLCKLLVICSWKVCYLLHCLIYVNMWHHYIVLLQ
jgi:hypothetical protein